MSATLRMCVIVCSPSGVSSATSMDSLTLLEVVPSTTALLNTISMADLPPSDCFFILTLDRDPKLLATLKRVDAVSWRCIRNVG